MHYFGHTIDNGVKFLYFVRSLLPSKSPILTKYWWVPLLKLKNQHKIRQCSVCACVCAVCNMQNVQHVKRATCS